MAGGYFELLEWLVKRGNKVFVDLKFFDVPETVRRAVANLRGRGVSFASVHGNQAMMEAAAQEKGEVKILAVTALTSLDRGDLDDLGFSCDLERLVLSRARRALQAGCDGVVSSGLEAQKLKAEFQDKLLVVTPGIRPVKNEDDQKRTVDAAQAFANGADYIVVGRPARKTPAGIARRGRTTRRRCTSPRIRGRSWSSLDCGHAGFAPCRGGNRRARRARLAAEREPQGGAMAGDRGGIGTADFTGDYLSQIFPGENRVPENQ